jgi:phosphoglucomutase
MVLLGRKQARASKRHLGYTYPSVDTAMACDEKARLFDKYNKFTEELIRASKVLAIVAGTSAPNYAKLKVKFAEARLNARLAGAEYDRHVSEHGCQ